MAAMSGQSQGAQSANKSSDKRSEDKKAEDIEERAELSTPMIYEILRRDGLEEMDRPASSLWWSGVAGGLSISFSLLAEGVLHHALPTAGWTHLVTSFGYPVGFMMVILARQQLFTENTITGVLPFAAKPSRDNLGKLARLWLIVLVANLAGTFLAALFWTYTPVVTVEMRAAMLEVAAQTLTDGPWAMACKAAGAGFLMAAMVWLIPNAETAKIFVVGVMTYVISIAGFAHIVAGTLESYMLVLAGRESLGHLVLVFGGPTLLGNIIGGTALFTLISHAQVADEMPDKG
jgi:formate/nitrite transporter FocA (FNT family)